MKKKILLLAMVALSGQLIIKSDTTVGTTIKVKPGIAEVGEIRFTNKTNKPVTLTAYNIDKNKNTGSTTIAAKSYTSEAYSYDNNTISCKQDGKSVNCDDVITADETTTLFVGGSKTDLGMY